MVVYCGEAMSSWSNGISQGLSTQTVVSQYNREILTLAAYFWSLLQKLKKKIKMWEIYTGVTELVQASVSFHFLART